MEEPRTENHTNSSAESSSPSTITTMSPIKETGQKTTTDGKQTSELNAISYLSRAIRTTSIHRLGCIYELESKILKTILIFLFLLSASYCTYQILNTIIAYAVSGILTTTSYIYEIPAEFPVVQFCNLNPIDQNYASEVLRAILDDGYVNASYYTNKPSLYYVEAVNSYFRAQLLKRTLDNEFKSENECSAAKLFVLASIHINQLTDFF
jgi:hypothetical protein